MREQVGRETENKAASARRTKTCLRVRPRRPDQKPADWVTLIKGREQLSDLLAVPDVPALEFR